MRLGSIQEVRTSDEKAFRRQLDEMDFDQPDGTLCAVFGDVLEDNNKGGIGYRRLAACIQVGAVLGAYRVVPEAYSGISPLELPLLLGRRPGVMVASGGPTRFICGQAAHQIARDDPRVEKIDSFPALHAARLPGEFRTTEVAGALSRGAFNTAKLANTTLYVFDDLERLASTLAALELNNAAWVSAN